MESCETTTDTCKNNNNEFKTEKRSEDELDASSNGLKESRSLDSTAAAANNGRCSGEAPAAASSSSTIEKDEPPNNEQNDQCQQQQQAPDTKSKTDKIKEVVEKDTSEDSKKKINKILGEVEQLSDLEKLLLYLKLPAGNTVEVDPLKQAFISSLGNRYEVTQTVTWIQSHLEEDPEVSLPKQEVYDGYCEFCQRVKMKPLSTADFGKVMKQVFLGVRPRRLGTRGNSRYCYAGLRKKLLLDSPKLPDLSLTHEETCEDGDLSDSELTGVSSHLVREWAEKLLGQKFSNLRELACHLVENSYVNNRSVAAFTLLPFLSNSGVGKGSQSCIFMNQCIGSKHRETQLQLQRKLQERELIREQKKKLLEQRGQVGRNHSEKGSPFLKVGRKSVLNAKSHSDDLRTMLSSSSAIPNGTSELHPTSLEHSLQELKKEPQQPVTQDLKGVNAAMCEAQGSGSPAGIRSSTPFFSQRTGGCQQLAAASRRTSKVGEMSSACERRRSRSSLDGDSQAGWSSSVVSSALADGVATAKGIATNLVTRPHSRVTELLRSSDGCSEHHSKTGKVLIPRVKSGQGSSSNKMCLAPTSIIIFPQISGSIPISSDYNNGSGVNKLKSKYKPIQPKPISRSSSTDDGGRNVGDPKDGSETTVTVGEDKNGQDVTITPAGSQSSSLDGFNPNQKLLPTAPTGQSASNTLAEEGICVDDGSNVPQRRKGGKRRHKRSTESLDNQGVKLKRPYLPSSLSDAAGGQEPQPLDANENQEKTTDSSHGEMSITTLENDAWMEYLGGSVPYSNEADEDAFHCFDNEMARLHKSQHLGGSRSSELSQLRRLLEQNLQKASQDVVLSDIKGNSGASSSGSVSSVASMPTLRHLLSKKRQQQLIRAGDISSTDPCLSQASSRIHSPNNIASGPQSPRQFGSVEQHPDSGCSDVLLSGMMKDGTFDLHAAAAAAAAAGGGLGGGSGVGVNEMCRDDVFGQEDFGMVKSMRGSEDPMFSSDSNSGCHMGSVYQTVTCEADDIPNAVQFGNGISDECHLATSQNAGDLRQYDGGYHRPEGMTSGGYVPHIGGGGGQSSVPPSPNTRRRAFNFMPISPRNTPIPDAGSIHSASHSPLFFPGSVSGSVGSSSCAPTTSAPRSVTATAPQSASTATSPFISPRSTPSSHCRSRHNSGQAMSSNFGTPRATPHPLYAMEQQSSSVSSPFASPHPTPVPFSRSRHNSSQNVSRSNLMFSCNAALTAATTRSRHASDLGLIMMSPGSAPLSPLEHGSSGVGGGGSGGGGSAGSICDSDPTGTSSVPGSHFTLPSVGDTPCMRSRHSSNSSVPPNSPRSAPMSPMVSVCPTNVIQDGYSPDQTVPFGKPILGHSPVPPLSHVMSHRHCHLLGDMAADDPGKNLHHDLQWSAIHEQKYQPPGACKDGPLQRSQPPLQQSVSWSAGVSPLNRQVQVDPRLVSRQRHSSMGATVHHHPTTVSHLPPPPPSTLHVMSSSSSSETAPDPVRLEKKHQASLPPLESLAASRCRSVPIYQMLENATQQQEHLESPFNDVMMSKSYPATPISQMSFTFDSSAGAMAAEYSPMVGGGASGGGGKVDQAGSEFGGEQVCGNLSESLVLPHDQFQNMLQTTFEDLNCVDDFSKFTQELEQYTSSTQS